MQNTSSFPESTEDVLLTEMVHNLIPIGVSEFVKFIFVEMNLQDVKYIKCYGGIAIGNHW